MSKKIASYLLNNNEVLHQEIDFVNTKLSRDIRLFIDPVLIETGSTLFCKKSAIKIKDYFNQLHTAYYVTGNEEDKMYLLSHANEINDTHLGYANKYGKGNTEEGLYNIFKGIDEYITSIKIKQMYELVLCIPNFAEDGMSDLLTNILYKELSEFTAKQCQKYGLKTTNCPSNRFFWDIESHTWKKYIGKSLVIEGQPYILVPKEIVQTHFRFTTDNFLRSVIVENIRKEKTVYRKDGHIDRPSKGEIRQKLLKENGSVFTTIHKFVEEDDNLLVQYQNIIKDKYKTLTLSDIELDKIVYKKK